MRRVFLCRRFSWKKITLYLIIIVTTILELYELRDFLKCNETKEFVHRSIGDTTFRPVARPASQVNTHIATKYERNFGDKDRNLGDTDRNFGDDTDRNFEDDTDRNYENTKGRSENKKRLFGNKIKTILLWNDYDFYDSYTNDGRDVFRKLNCEYSNCYLTINRSHLPSVADFDAILFNINGDFLNERPKTRSKKQKYIAMSREPPNQFDYNMLLRVLNDFFNLTFTYKLDSDITFRHYIIYDENGRDIAPTLNVKWLKSYKPTAGRMKLFLRLKTKAVAWSVSQCKAASHRELYVQELSKEMAKLNRVLDIYGSCGKPCTDCKEMIGRDYHFYLAFENTEHVDYVSEEVLNAVLHNTVPIVKGGADYTRFLPPGSYIDANKFSPRELARKIDCIMSNRTAYEDHFLWTNHYIFKHDPYQELCGLCKTLNNDTVMNKETACGKFRYWWMGRSRVEELRDRLQKGLQLLRKIRNSKLVEFAKEVNKLYDFS